MQAAQGSQSTVRALQEQPQTGKKKKADRGEKSPACISGVSYSVLEGWRMQLPLRRAELRGFEQPEPAGLGNARCPVSGFLLCLINFIIIFFFLV